MNKASPLDQKITVSIGLSASLPLDTLHESVLIDNADKALYAAKHSGRDRICLQYCEPAAAPEEMPRVLS